MGFDKIRYVIFFALLIFITGLFLYILKPFAYPLFWAAIIAGIFYPMYKWFLKKTKIANLSATISVMIVILCIILPLTLIGILLARESISLYVSLGENKGQISESIQGTFNWIKNSPLTSQLNINESFWTQKFSEITQILTNSILSTAKTITQNSLSFLLMFFVMLYALFFFFRDGEKFLKKLMYICPLGDKYEKMLYQKFTDTTHAILKGVLLVASIQAGLGVLLFAITGIQGALIWGIFMFVFAMIPNLGTGVIWLPTGVIMLITGHIWQGVMILVFGALVISTIDNLLRPVLIGKKASMHPLLILFSMLGGLFVFGLSGFIIGPVVVALLIAFWDIYNQYYREDLERN
jgi:predicted PurR-regulated permease PerM